MRNSPTGFRQSATSFCQEFLGRYACGSSKFRIGKTERGNRSKIMAVADRHGLTALSLQRDGQHILDATVPSRDSRRRLSRSAADQFPTNHGAENCRPRLGLLTRQAALAQRLVAGLRRTRCRGRVGDGTVTHQVWEKWSNFEWHLVARRSDCCGCCL